MLQPEPPARPPLPRMILRTTLLLLSVLALGCRTTQRSAPAGADEAEISVGRLVAAWRICDGESTLGWLKRYSASESQQTSIFVVQNQFMQDLGYVDSHGRAWRRQPHQEESLWLTTETVLEGTRQILGLSAHPQLIPTPLQQLDPSALEAHEGFASEEIPAAGLESASIKKPG